MLFLSHNILKQIDSADLRQSAGSHDKNIELYSGKSGDLLEHSGLLNVLIRDQVGNVLACPVAEIENSNITVRHQEGMLRPNSSAAVGLSVDGTEAYIQHWDGFLSIFNINTFEILGQEFTK